MDRQAWIAVTLCVLGLVGWQVYMASHAPRVAPATAASATASPSAPATVAPLVSPTPGATPLATAAIPGTIPEVPATFAEKTEILRNSDLELHLTNRGGGISEARLLKQKGENGQGVITLNAAERPPIGAIIPQPGVSALAEFTAVQSPDGGVQFTRTTPDGLTIQKTFSLPRNNPNDENYVVDLAVDFRNDGTEKFHSPGYYVALGSAVPLHPRDLPSYTRVVWCLDGKAKGIDSSWFAASNYPFTSIQKHAEQKFYQQPLPDAEWAAVSNQFFTTIVTPLDGKLSDIWARRFEIPQKTAASIWGLEAAIGMPAFDLPPGGHSTLHFQIYAGPKIYHRLVELGHDEAAVMDFGIWKLVSQALLNFMNLLHRWVGSYGLAIILLTAVVKGALWPLQNKANKSMRRMSALAPRIQALKEKYKDDPTKMNQETMKLYKEQGVNPVGGCLPMVIQIPIFFGLFTMLRQVAELRGAPFLWIHDLSQPDTLFTIPGLGWIPILGNPLTGLPVNILPLIMGATSFWMTRMTPKTGDATQQRLMMFTPLIFLVFCYNFAAALALYYTTQNLFTILQLWQNQRQPAPEVATVAPVGKRAKKGRS